MWKNLDNKKIIALSAYDRSFIIINTETFNIEVKPCRMNIEDVRKYFGPMTQNEFGEVGESPYQTNENGLWRNIDSFCKYVQSDVHDRKIQKKAYAKIIKNIDGSSGEKIHQYIMAQI